MNDFNSTSYLSQVRQLRKLAIEALKLYAIEVIQLKFINHGENTTYKVVSKKGNFLLRIHRKDYHSKNAILEELEWVKQLSENNEQIQKPILSINGKLVEEVSFGKTADSRYCSVLTWVDGKMRYKSITQNALRNAGQLAGQLHQNADKIKVKHRQYWTAEGLLGANAKFGGLHKLKPEISKAQYEVIEACRKMTFQKVKQYRIQNPHKSSMIHADLHFGNIIWQKDNAIPIDFDDCGFGFHMYDLAITLSSADHFFKSTQQKTKQAFVESLLEGYSATHNLSRDDIEILPYFKLTRSLVMLGWVHERKDNPSIYKHFKQNLKTKIKYYKKVVKKGPDLLY